MVIREKARQICYRGGESQELFERTMDKIKAEEITKQDFLKVFLRETKNAMLVFGNRWTITANFSNDTDDLWDTINDSCIILDKVDKEGYTAIRITFEIEE